MMNCGYYFALPTVFHILTFYFTPFNLTTPTTLSLLRFFLDKVPFYSLLCFFFRQVIIWFTQCSMRFILCQIYFLILEQKFITFIYHVLFSFPCTVYSDCFKYLIYSILLSSKLYHTMEVWSCSLYFKNDHLAQTCFIFFLLFLFL